MASLAKVTKTRRKRRDERKAARRQKKVRVQLKKRATDEVEV